MSTPKAPFTYLSTLWIQITGTWCNLTCTHCLNSSGPKDPWLKNLDPPTVRRYLREAEELGVKDIYFTGGEPFLHPDLLPLLTDALAVAPVTVLTNGILITDTVADRLAAMATASPYSLEIRISIDGATPEENDRVRGRGSFQKALDAFQRLNARGLLPILTATEIVAASVGDAGTLYDRFRSLLLDLGIQKPRVKILPVLPVGRMEGSGRGLLTEAILEGFDYSLLQCSETRVVAADGVYACPILAGLDGARLSDGSLEEAMRPCRLYHPACVTCYETGMSCKN